MANPRAAVSEERWREIKDELVARTVHQQKQLKVAPNVRLAEDWLTPILRQVVVQHEERRRTDMLRQPKQKPAPFGQRPGDGEETVLGRRRGVDRRGFDVAVKETSDAELDRMRQKHRPTEWKVIRARIRDLLKFPEWRARISDTIFGPTAPDTTREKRIEQWLKIYDDSCKVFGDPLKPQEKKIILAGAPPAEAPQIVVVPG